MKLTNGSCSLETCKAESLVTGIVRRTESRVIRVELEQLRSIVGQCSGSNTRTSPGLNECSIDYLRGIVDLRRKNSACRSD